MCLISALRPKTCMTDTRKHGKQRYWEQDDRAYESRFPFSSSLWEYLENSVTSTQTHTLQLYDKALCLFLLWCCCIILDSLLKVSVLSTMSCDFGLKVMHNVHQYISFHVVTLGIKLINRLYILQPYLKYFNSLIV